MVLAGIELALAVAPLIIVGAEYYRKVHEKSKTALRSKVKNEKLLDFYRNLHIEIGLLNYTLRQLVSDLPTIPEQQKELLLEHDRTLWNEPSVRDALSDRLGDQEAAFEEILNKILNALEKVISDKSLHLTEADINQSGALHNKLEAFRPETFRRSPLDDLKERLRFTANEKTRIVALNRIEQCNKKLERLLRPSHAGYEGNRNTRRKAPPRIKCRRLTNELHSAIAQHWSCDCETPHEARLCLLQSGSSNDSSSTVTSLDMLISTKSDNKNKRAWQESNVRILAEKEAHQAKTTVRFQVNGARIQTTTIQNLPRQMVESLCFLLERPADGISLGIEFEEGKLWRVKPRRRSLCVQEPEVKISLDRLLRDPQVRMSLKQKRILAVVIARAVLNFCESPWLNENWDKKHISFYINSAGDGGPDFERPYLSTNFQDSAQAVNDESTFLSLHRSPAILALGILLLEIELSEPIEDHYVEEDLENDLPNPNTNLTTAERLLKRSVDEIYERYRMAIEACLDCGFANFIEDTSLENEIFREQVYENIIAPLEEELEHGWGLTVEKLQAF